MAQLPTIEFICWTDPKGYRLEKKPDGALRVVRNGSRKDELVAKQPIGSADELFLIFAKLATTPEGVLRFVQLYGPLTPAANDPGDIVELVIFNARCMQGLLKSILIHRQSPTVPGKIDRAPTSALHAAVVWDPEMKGPRWKFRPNTLLDGLWLQFGQAITRGKQIRTCAHCGKWFETGAGTGRRLDAKFCSDEHRIAFNSLKRSKEK